MRDRSLVGASRMLTFSCISASLPGPNATLHTESYSLHRVDSLNVRDDTEIDWKTLPDVGWNFWSAHSLQRRWLTLKRSIKGFEEMTHAEIMDILRHKKAQLPVPPITSSKKRKIITSTASVADSDVADGGVGSSTGPGTLQGA